MKNFNWEAFKRGDIAVHCDTEEKAKDFLMECDKNDIKWEGGRYTPEFTKWDIFKEGTSYSYFINGITIIRLDLDKAQGLKIIEWEIDAMKELTFTEVIANIKEGQVWESCAFDNLNEISLNKAGNLDFKFINNSKEMIGVNIEHSLYKLKRKEYTFQEAFKTYEEGKVIESKFSTERYRLVDGIDEIYAPEDDEWTINDYGLDLKEIRNKWYINN